MEYNYSGFTNPYIDAKTFKIITNTRYAVIHYKIKKDTKKKKVDFILFWPFCSRILNLLFFCLWLGF